VLPCQRLPVSALIILAFCLRATASAWGEAGPPAGAEPGPAVPAHLTAAEVCPCTFGPLIADTAIPIEKGRLAVQPQWAVGFTRADLTPSWRQVSAGGNFTSFQMPVKITYGPVKNLEVYLVAQYLHNWASSVNEPGPQGERSADFGGLGDLNLTFKYQFLEETDLRPTVTGHFAVDFPTGHHAPLNPGRLGADDLGGGAYRFTVGLDLSKWLKPFIFYGNLWYSHSLPCRCTVEDEVLGPVVQVLHARDALTFRLAAEYPIGGQGPWVALLEFYSSWEVGPVFGPRAQTAPAALLGVLPGLEYIVSDRLGFAAGVALDLAGKNTDARITPIFSLIYTF
jgi:hypothetical protein